MTLHEYPDVEQRSDEWHTLRRGIVTASAVGQLLTPTLKVADNDTSRALTTTLAVERINGWSEETRMTDDMWRGVEHEPIARDLYSEHHAPATEFGFMLREEDGWALGLSPDGVVDDIGLIEIKCPRAKAHFRTILTGSVPSQYLAQCQAALLVSGRAWLDYVSFHAGMPLKVIRVYPDPDWFDAIEAACRAFETNVAALVDDYNSAVAGLPTTERVLEEEIRF
jgi:putative phage-type endonuclease